MISKIAEKLRNAEYRNAFNDAVLRNSLPFQIRAIRKARDLTQQQLAERTGMKQSRISAIQSAGASHLTLTTLLRLAQAFDCGLLVRFVPFSRLIAEDEAFHPEDCSVAAFEEEDRAGRIEAVTKAKVQRDDRKVVEMSGSVTRLYSRRSPVERTNSGYFNRVG